MTCLLDTHTILWWLENHPRLSPTAQQLICDPANRILVSPISGYEISFKTRLGKLRVPFDSPSDFSRELGRERWDELPITLEHAITAGQLPPEHRDPFDRLLAAQALVEGATLLTADPAFNNFPDLATLW